MTLGGSAFMFHLSKKLTANLAPAGEEDRFSEASDD
jgi:hypothetical protein